MYGTDTLYLSDLLWSWLAQLAPVQSVKVELYQMKVISVGASVEKINNKMMQLSFHIQKYNDELQIHF